MGSNLVSLLLHHRLQHVLGSELGGGRARQFISLLLKKRPIQSIQLTIFVS